MRRLALLLAATAPLLAADGIQGIPLRSELSAENLKLPGGETMGLLGLTTTTDLGPAYLGAGIYGAGRGQRGGLFVFGLEGGLRGRPFENLPVEFDAGLFVGGGGGAAAPQGGGLMLRPHAGASVAFGRLRVGAQLSQVRFPSGDIRSTEAAFTIAYITDHLWKPEGALAPVFDGPVAWDGRELQVVGSTFHPTGASRTRTGRPQNAFDLGGFRFTTQLDGPFFRYFEADGAARGGSAGYAQALAGIGAHANLQGPLGVEARLGAGLGGGGNTDTGGGLIVSGEGAITLGEHDWRASLGFGYLKAPAGRMSGSTMTLGFAYRYQAPVPSSDGAAVGTFDLTDWRVGSGLLVYRHAPRRNGNGAVQELTLRADRLLDNGFYLSAEAGSATGGGAGGYSSGLAGLGWETPALFRARLFVEAALGAGGGGGLQTGGGMLSSLRAGCRLALPGGLGLDAAVGKASASKLDTPTLGLGVHFRFSAPERSY